MSNPSNDQLLWPWWKAIWDSLLILFSASIISYAVAISLPPQFYQTLFPGMEQFEAYLARYIFMLLVWPGLQALIIFKWMNWRGVQHVILPLWPLSISVRKAAAPIALQSVTALIGYFALDYFGFFSPSPDFEFYVYVMNSALAPMLVVAGVVAAPIAEEAIFRGFMQSAFQGSRLGFWGASFIVSCMWSLSHWYEWSVTLLIIAIGVSLTVLRRRTGSLLPGMLAHGIINLVIFLNFVGSEV